MSAAPKYFPFRTPYAALMQIWIPHLACGSEIFLGSWPVGGYLLVPNSEMRHCLMVLSYLQGVSNCSHHLLETELLPQPPSGDGTLRISHFRTRCQV